MNLEDLKYTLLNLYCSDGANPLLEHFYMDEGKIVAKCRNVVLEGRENEIDVYFDNSSYLYPKKLEYLNRENTLKTFQASHSAIEYLHYLIRATKDVRFELFHYFLFKIQEIKIEYKSWSFYYTNNKNLDQLIINLGIGKITIKGKVLNFDFHIMFFKSGTCQLTFHPEKPVWDEGKVCPETQIDSIIDFITNITDYYYEAIPLNEI